MRRRCEITAMVVMTIVMVAGLSGAAVTEPPEIGSLNVERWNGAGWEVVSRMVFGLHLEELKVQIPGQGSKLRLVRKGSTTAHVDIVTLGGEELISPTDDGPANPAEKKLAKQDLDVFHLPAWGRIELDFPPAVEGSLKVVARFEPETVRGVPFLYPTANQFAGADRLQTFYAYSLGSRTGHFVMDGALDDECLGEPLFAQLSRPSSGHPAGTTVAWMCNDHENLYAALDFQSDNTWDDGADFAALHVRTPTGIQAFRVSEKDRAWGRPSFAYTQSVPYQHSIYEFTVPLHELGLEVVQAGTQIDVAFEAYGTVAIYPLVDLFNAPAAGQTVADACSIAIDDAPPPGSILGSNRELSTSDAGITAGVNFAPDTGLLTADFSTTAGTVLLVWDGDINCSTQASLTANFGPYDRVTLVRTNNPGTQSVDATVRIRAWNGATVTTHTLTKIIPAGASTSHVEFPFASFIPVLASPATFDIRGVELELVAAIAIGDSITIDEFVPSNGAVPVELQAFVLE